MKRLMGRYATHENEVDSLLRAEIFVDLFSVVRHGIRASVESYSIKKLEPLYSFVRTVPLEDVGAVEGDMGDGGPKNQGAEGVDDGLDLGELGHATFPGAARLRS